MVDTLRPVHTNDSPRNSMPRRRLILFALALTAAAGFGAYLYRQILHATTPSLPDAALAQLYATTLPDPTGKTQSIAAWRGKVLVVNFWATWCPPCRREMPGFSRLHDKLSVKGVQFVGIGVDSPNAIKEFALQTPVSYPLLISGLDGLELTRVLGNESGALPHTLVFGRDGRLAFSRLGMLEEAELEALLTKLIGA